MKKLATIIGPYRYHNFGDDLIGVILVKYLRNSGYDAIIPSLSKENSQWLNIEYSDSAKKSIKKSDVIVIGGGGILGDSGIKPDNYYLKRAFKAGLYGFLKGKKVIVTGVGAGPLKMYSSRILTVSLGMLASKLGVRDIESKTFLLSLGINKSKIILGSDIALLWPDILDIKNVVGSKIGIQFDINSFVESDIDKYKYLKDMLSSYVNNNQRKIALITNGNYSSQIYRTEWAAVNEYKYSSIPEFMEKFVNLKVILTSHLHLAIAAYAAKIPCFSIYLREKTKRFYKQIGHPERAISLYKCNKETLSKFLNQMDKVKWTSYDDKKLSDLKKSALKLVDFKAMV